MTTIPGTPVPATAEAVIIGGGVMGASILHSLAVRGMTNTLLLERDVLGAGSTGRSSSAIRMHYSTEVHARMAWESFKVFRDFGEIVGGECGYTRTGHLIMGAEEDADTFRANVAMQQSVGIETGLVTREEARELAPSFYLEDCGVIAYEPVCGYGDASATCASFAQAARDRGARVVLRLPCRQCRGAGWQSYGSGYCRRVRCHQPRGYRHRPLEPQVPAGTWH